MQDQEQESNEEDEDENENDMRQHESSQMENTDDQTVDAHIISQMKQVAVLYDSQPIRAVCFSPNSSQHFVLGTNSKSLKFCKMSQSIINSVESDIRVQDDSAGISVIYE